MKGKNLKKLPKIQILKFVANYNMRHTFWSWLKICKYEMDAASTVDDTQGTLLSETSVPPPPPPFNLVVVGGGVQ